MTQWENLVVLKSVVGTAAITLQNMLNRYGEEGWELCGVTDRFYILKRIKVDDV